MNKEKIFRLWFYFRQGWSIYLAFIFSAVNTLVVTYYLAIEKIPLLKEVFPSFIYYVLLIGTTSVPLLVLIGYAHVKRSAAYKAEADIQFIQNPNMKRLLINTEMILKLHLQLNQTTLRLSKNEKLDEKEIQEIQDLNNKLTEYIKQSLLP